MKRFLKAICMIIAAVCLFCVGETAMAAKKVVAVPAIDPRGGLSLERHAAVDFEEQLVSVLVQSGRYDVVERGRLDVVMEELALSQTGLISGETAQRFGQMTGADYTVVAKVIAADFGRFNNYVYGGHKAKVKVSVRFVDNQSGIVKVSEVLEGSRTVTDYEDKSPDRDMMIASAVNDVSRKVLELIDSGNVLTGVLMGVNGEQAYIDLGEESGVKTGSKYIVFREGKPIIHPVTKEIIGIEEITVGEVKVTEVKANYSVCEITKGKGQLHEGDKVKRLGKK